MLDWLSGFLQTVIGAILAMLPHSPFASFIDELSGQSWIGYLNYFMPVQTFLRIGTAWCVAIGTFYAYQIILRWARAVGD